MSSKLPRARLSLKVWTILTVAGFLAMAATFVVWSRTTDPSDPTPEPKKDVRVVVVKDGDDPEAYVHREGDENEDDADRPKRSYLGVSIEEDTKNPEGGARVETVSGGSPADKAGIRRGDTIVGFGGDVIRGPVRLTEKIRASHPGDRVEVKLVRKDGRKETVTVEVGEREARGFWYGFGEGDQLAPLPDLKGLDDLGEKIKRLHVTPRAWIFRGDRPKLGVELVETTPELREHLGGSDDAGVLVGKVLSGTPAQKAGVRVGDLIVSVDGDRVSDAGALIEALSDKDGKTISLELVRDRKTIRLQVSIPPSEDAGDEPRGPRASRAHAHERALQEMQRDLRRAVEEQVRAARESSRLAAEEVRRAVSESRRESIQRVAEDVRRAMDQAREELRRARMESKRAVRPAAGII